MYYNITICHRTYRMHHHCYGYENFPNTIMLLKVDCFEGFSDQTNFDELVINNSTRGYSYNKLTVHYLKTRRS